MLYRTSLSAPMFGLRRDIDRLFEDTFSRSDGVNSWTPAVDVSESPGELRLEIELPGMRPEDVEITAENNVMTVRGEKRGERKEGEEGIRYHLIERSYGSFTRSFQLPQGLDESKIEAEANNGVLSIRIPKAALPKPRRIQIGRDTTGIVGGEPKGSQISQQDGARAAQRADVRSQAARAEASTATGR